MTRREFEITDINEIVKILEKAKIIHLGLVDDGMPYLVPMNYGFEIIDGKLVIYMHSGLKGYKLDVIRKNPVCCFEIDCDIMPFEGKVACQYGTSYSSVIGRGEVEILEDAAERMDAMKKFMKTQTGRDFEFTDKMLSAVAMLRINVDEFTAKHRPAPETRANV
ncbi:MAG: pyridoxamine 5'-phosphate oxidase family protein [Firmicutes bacterium]|nr:pyridoxamine 5'-phosphate oxidase family protein [Bacillota bacterium]